MERAQSILEYLTALGPDALSGLYRDAFACLTVFRSLPALAKQYAARLLCVPEGVPLEVFERWPLVTGDERRLNRELHARAVRRLRELSVLELRGAGAAAVAALNPTFRDSLQRALGNREERTGAVRAGADEAALAELEEFADAKWNALLHHMVGARYRDAEVDEGARSLLLGLGLMQRSGTAAAVITAKGFRFLFQTRNMQVWALLIGYLGSLQERHLDRDEVLTFLFRLSFLEVGREFSVGELTQTQKVLLLDLAMFGLVRVKGRRYQATSLAACLSSKPVASAGDLRMRGNIIVETSFRVAAYTSSPFQQALLGLFCELQYRLPNMLVGKLTKRSVRRALKKGITAREIVAYLRSSLHSVMMGGADDAGLPDNVVEQLELWEQERQRFALEPARLLTAFARPEDFDRALRFAQEKNMHRWHRRFGPVADWSLAVDSASFRVMRAFLQGQSAPP